MGCQENCVDGENGSCVKHSYEQNGQKNGNVEHINDSITVYDLLSSQNNKLMNDNIHPEASRRDNEDKKWDKKAREMWLYRGHEVDLSKFARFHPGGTSHLKKLRGYDVEPTMRQTQHTPESYYLLRDFYNGNSEEDIVDWNKPMLAQVGSLGPLYESWVWSPVYKPLRLFQSDLLEKLTRTNWKQVVGTWVPVITISLALSFHNAQPSLDMGMKLIGIFSSLVCGMAVWPLLEYSIHRWIFHLQPPKSSALLITLHFGLHGLHHKVPFDDGRLLFPPVPCSIMAIAVYNIYTSMFAWWIAIALFAGTMLGYLMYDLIHYYLHHGNPNEGTYLYHMKRYHNQHHFAQQELGFGISSDFWDHAFDTLIKLKSLSKPLSWDN